MTKGKLFKTLCAVLLLAQLLTLVSSTAFAAGENRSGNYTYKILSDGTAEITRYNGRDTSITIPEELDGHTVSTVGEHAFMYCSASSISIGTNIVHIKEGGFFGCKASTIRIDANDIVIGKEAFSCCSGIDSFTLVANNVTIGKYAFMYAKPMSTFTWELADPNATGVKVTLDEGAFFSSNITSIHIPGDELVIGKEAFSCCSNIESFWRICSPGG